MLSRRLLLAGLALVSALASVPVMAQQTDALPSWNDGPAKTAILDLVHATTTPGSPDFVAPEIQARHLRPGRHALGRAPDLQPGRVRARSGGGAGTRASRVEAQGAVQDGPLR